MARTKVLIAVKTYPNPSRKYEELVCTAGFTENGDWVRIYPVPFRKMRFENQYKKYDWIEFDLIKNESDFRPESYRLCSSRIEFLGHLKPEDNWAKRKKYVLKKVYNNMTELIAEAKNRDKGTSLAVFKPSRIINFTVEKTGREWDKNKLDEIKSKRSQKDLFQPPKDLFQIVKKLPYKFSYLFEDYQGKKCKLMIEDWETGQLYWNCLARHKGDEAKAVEDVKKKYFDDFAKKKDLHLFLGTTYRHHHRSRNPFVIIGTFHPSKEDQLSLF